MGVDSEYRYKKVLKLSSRGGGEESDPGLPLISQRLRTASGKQDTEEKIPEIAACVPRKQPEKEQVRWVGVLRQPGASK